MPIQTILFDLDGTLIDSSKGILKSLEYAFEKSSIRPSVPLSEGIIGPPLPELVRSIAGRVPMKIIDAIIADFACYYDNKGCYEDIIYTGIEHVLRRLENNHINLHVATNKRQRPTHQILSNLGIAKYFTSVYCPDTLNPKACSKAHLLEAQLRNEDLCSDQCIYVGDRQEDWSAARSNGIRFAWASWGFSADDLKFEDDSVVLESPETMIDICSP